QQQQKSTTITNYNNIRVGLKRNLSSFIEDSQDEYDDDDDDNQHHNNNGNSSGSGSVNNYKLRAKNKIKSKLPDKNKIAKKLDPNIEILIRNSIRCPSTLSKIGSASSPSARAGSVWRSATKCLSCGSRGRPSDAWASMRGPCDPQALERGLHLVPPPQPARD